MADQRERSKWEKGLLLGSSSSGLGMAAVNGSMPDFLKWVALFGIICAVAILLGD